jgi:hypothetical protein
MSERIYSWLLGLYPFRFREACGADALQLFRDRCRDERGVLPRLRLWVDLLTDLAVSIPREYRCAGASLAGDPAQQRLHGTPGFNVLDAEAPRLGAQFCAAMLSLATFGAIPLLISHGGNWLPPSTWTAQAKHGSHLLFSPRLGPVRQRTLGAGEEIRVSGEASTGTRSAGAVDLEFANSRPGEFQIKLVSLSGGVGFFQAQATQPMPQDATGAIIEAFKTHDIVMFGETHGNKQEYEWLCKMVSTPKFDDRVDDIVVEFGNSLYQKSVDGYIAGEDVPIEQVQKAWRNMIGSVGPPSPVYEQFYKAVREANLRRRGKHQMRILLGDPYGDWEKIKDAEDVGPYLAHRDEWYAQVVKEEVLAKHHRALLIMGEGHFLRRNGPGLVEREIRAAGANPYLVVFGTNAAGGYDDLDKRFDTWPAPTIASLAGTWVGELPAMPVTTGGTVPASGLKLRDAADALLYVGPWDELTQLRMPRAELDGTPYGNEMTRRLTIQMGRPVRFLYDQTEVPQFERPQPRPQAQAQPQSNAAGRPALPPMPKSMNDPLPPRPPSE